MTEQPEDKIYWGEQLENLPASIRAAIIAIRLGGANVIILLLAGTLIGMQLGLLPDQAARDREAMMIETRQQSEQIRTSQELLDKQVRSLEEHVQTTKLLAIVMCANLSPNTYERNRCLEITNGVKH